ncbi:hypothetical protein CS542_04805 [Pedobacter sp. IW39]|nr:hypothetical protein CS542_04805 [Pedobacter sp. IW39]
MERIICYYNRVFLDSHHPSTKRIGLFSADQDQLITSSRHIIPSTKTPGAKAAGVGPWISMMVRDCYPKEAQDVLSKALKIWKPVLKTIIRSFGKRTRELLGKVR